MRFLSSVSTWARSIGFVLMVVIIGGKIQAQGIVHVVPPDPQPRYFPNYPGTFYSPISIVEDGTTDFILESGAAFVGYATLTPQNSNLAVVQSGFVAAMNRGDIIGAALASTNQWATGRLTISILATLLGQIPGGNGEDGNFAHRPSGYIGFDLVDNGTNYYGWMLASCPSLGGLTGDAGIFAYITDWAFETSPNTPIQAGQIREPISFTANLTGANETPPNRSGHSGLGNFTLESYVDGFVLNYSFSYDGAFQPVSAGIFGPANPGQTSRLLTNVANFYVPPPASPPHRPPGLPGLGIFPGETPTEIFFSGQVALSSNQAVQLARGQLYVNFKSRQFPQGELRGQIWPDTPLQFTASLSGRREDPHSPNGHPGEAAFTLSGANLTGDVALDANFTWSAMGIYAPPFAHEEALVARLTNVFGVMIPPGGLPGEPGLPGQVLYSESATLTDRQVVQLKSGQLFLQVLTPHNRNCQISGRIVQVQ